MPVHFPCRFDVYVQLTYDFICFFFVIAHVTAISGGYSAGVPPLPIPNREVKPGHADGTAQQWESR